MNIESSYAAEIFHADKIFRNTVKTYREAVSFCIDVFEREWGSLSVIKNANTRRNACEVLIHSTSKRQAKYPEFDKLFYKMPAYMRRAVVVDAYGCLSSYHSNVDEWKTKGSKGKEPMLRMDRNCFPTFYRKGACLGNERTEDTVQLKLLVNNDWVWVDFHLKPTDMKSVRKHAADGKISAPTLERKHKKWYLRYAMEHEKELNKTKLKNQRVLAVDLGINTVATCSVMDSEGTVYARKFINFPYKKDLLNWTLNRVKKVQRKYGNHNLSKIWRYAKSLNDQIAYKTADAIVNLAMEYGCDMIVFEYLDTSGKKRGSKKQCLHMWNKRAVQTVATHKAHMNGVHINRVCAWGTSRLAYDGSGRVLRGRDAGFDTYELCRFPSGKIYNCDLSASYNIGARYFIRELQKNHSAMKWSRIQAEVPECVRRSRCTYGTLLKINSVLAVA